MEKYGLQEALRELRNPKTSLKEDQDSKMIKREINDELISDLMNPEYDLDGFKWSFIDKKTGRYFLSRSFRNAKKGVIELYNGWGDAIQLPIDGSAKAGSTKDINRYEVYEVIF